MNMQIAQVYLQHSDPGLSARIWQHVTLDELTRIIDRERNAELRAFYELL